MAYVYRHIRLDKNQPFYIGIGKDDNFKRAYQKSKTKRSEYWHNIANNGYEVEILMDGLTWEEACEKEKEFISLYGRSDIGTGILCNHTCGGDGTKELSSKVIQSIKDKLTGRVQSEETRLKRKEKLRIVWQNQELRELKRMQSKNMMTLEMRERISSKSKGIKKRNLTIQEKNNISEKLKKYYQNNSAHNKILFSEKNESLIIKFYKDGLPISKIAKYFFVSRSVIYRILGLKY